MNTPSRWRARTAAAIAVAALSLGVAGPADASATPVELSSLIPPQATSSTLDGPVVHQGQEISVGGHSRCSITLVAPLVAYTAGHCATPGDIVTADGRPIGVVAASAWGRPLFGTDAARILLDPGARIADPHPLGTTFTLTPGTLVSSTGAMSGHRAGVIVEGPERSVRNPMRDAAVQHPVLSTNIRAQGGDSGSPVFDDRNGALIGILVGVAEDPSVDFSVFSPIEESVLFTLF